MKNCPNCLKDFEPNSGKQKFCSDKCKVAFGRKLAKDGVTTADKIPPPENEKNESKNSYSWVEEIEKYCGEEGITPEDLILSHKERNKPLRNKKGSNTSNKEDKRNLGKKNETESNSFWFSDYRKKKLGL
jgi:hypothetical protein